jgi:mannose-6-phosphate isomerase-like protein (cupin superfamily)
MSMLPPDGLEPALSFEALRSIASGLAWAQRPVPGDLGDLGDPAAARSLRLIATARYDVWVITWPAGSGLGPHDHGRARSVLHVVEGELIETFADQLEERPPRTRLLRAGDSTCGEASYLHDLENRSGRQATSLHVYSPPLSDLTLFQRFSSDEDHRRKKPVPARSAQATGSDLGLVKPAVLSLVET